MLTPLRLDLVALPTLWLLYLFQTVLVPIHMLAAADAVLFVVVFPGQVYLCQLRHTSTRQGDRTCAVREARGAPAREGW